MARRRSRSRGQSKVAADGISARKIGGLAGKVGTSSGPMGRTSLNRGALILDSRRGGRLIAARGEGTDARRDRRRLHGSRGGGWARRGRGTTMVPRLDVVTCLVGGTVGVTNKTILAIFIHVALSSTKVRREPRTSRWQSVAAEGSRRRLAGRGGSGRFFFDTVHGGLVEGCRLRKLCLRK